MLHSAMAKVNELIAFGSLVGKGDKTRERVRIFQYDMVLANRVTTT